MWDSKESITSIHEVAHRAFDYFSSPLFNLLFCILHKIKCKLEITLVSKNKIQNLKNNKNGKEPLKKENCSIAM